jgi:hypothetical protein
MADETLEGAFELMGDQVGEKADGVEDAEAGAGGGALYHPSVLIGVGGSGVECLRRAKLRIKERAGDLATTRYVYVDADTNSFVNAAGLAPVLNSEMCYIGGAALWPVIRNRADNKWLLDQIPGDLEEGQFVKPANGKGCGQIRAMGRVALLASWNNVHMVVSTAIGQVQELATQLEAQMHAEVNRALAVQPVIYVVGSLAGGTGSGTFLDVALLARRITNDQATIVGIIVLPEAFNKKLEGKFEEQAILRANTYAALKELQALQDFSHGVQFEVVVGHDGRKLELGRGRQLFDLCYLIDYKNQDRQSFSQTEDVYELVARLLMHENATPFGARNESVSANLTTLRGLSRCPKTNLYRCLSTFSNTRLGFPIGRLASFAASSTLEELLEQQVLRPQMAVELTKQEAQTFLTRHQLDESGDSDAVQDQLLQDPKTQLPLVAAEQLGPNFGKDDNRKRFAQKIRPKLTALESTTVPKAKTAVDANSAFYLGSPSEAARPIQAWLDAAVVTWLNNYGYRGSHGILSELCARTTAMRAEMLAENDTWTTAGSKEERDNLSAKLKRLEQMALLKAWLTDEDERLKAQSITSFNKIAKQDIRTPARNAAVKVFDELLTLLTARQEALANLIREATSLEGGLKAKRSKMRAQAKADTSNFVVDMDVTEPGYLEEFYKQHRLDTAAVWKRICDQQRDMGAFYQHLTRLTSKELAKTFYPDLYAQYVTAVKNLDVVEYIRQHAQDGGLGAKLAALFSMCQPFWDTQLPQAGMQYDHFLALGCKPLPDAAQGVRFPQEAQQWAQQYVHAGQGAVAARAILIPNQAGHELEIVRYTHGARAFYLTDALDWKTKYTDFSKRKAFPLHVAKCLEKAADLFPDEQEQARLAFALAMALGFIAKRGDYYYWNLKAEENPGQEGVQFEVLNHTDWQTIFGSSDARILPTETGPIAFTFKKRPRMPADLKISQGRLSALEALSKDSSKPPLIMTAVKSYEAWIGNAKVKKDYITYEKYLDDMQVTPELQQQIVSERELIKQYAKKLE